ncbi:Autophagy-related protein 14 [Exophiala dermatitidis]
MDRPSPSPSRVPSVQSLTELRDRLPSSRSTPDPQASLDAEAQAVKDHEITEHEIKDNLNPDQSSYIMVDKTPKMPCSVCQTQLSQEGGVHCAGCARAALYNVRTELAKVLLEKEALRRKVEAITGPEPDPSQPLDEETAALRSAWQAQNIRNQVQESKERTEETYRLISEKKKELEERKARAQELREKLGKRRTNLALAEESLAKDKKKHEEVKEAYGKQKAAHDTLHNQIVESKAALCRKAAGLLKLQHTKKKTKDGVVRDRYTIGGLLLPDLRDINNLRCTELTAAIGNAARLVILTAFYLGVRLPAELTSARPDYPLPTINTPLTSYSGQRVPFPGSGTSLSAPSSPTTSRLDLSSYPRPRPLYIGSDNHEESVSQFAKKEPVAFSFFLEGVSLLAWDIAWLARTQGFLAGTERWEDVCDLGRNLYEMILGPPQSAATFRTLTPRDIKNRQRRSESTSLSVPEGGPAISGRLGSQSHTSTHTHLGRATDNQTPAWRLNKYTTIVDPLKKHLLTEMNNAEWELLDEQEWDEGGEKMDEAVFIKTRAMDGKEYDDARSIMTTTTATKVAGTGGEEDGARGKGKSGWTKVKSREKV